MASYDVADYSSLSTDEKDVLEELRQLAVSLNADGVIMNAVAEGVGDTYVVTGRVYYDKKQRFMDGAGMHSAGVRQGSPRQIVNGIFFADNAYFVTTRNSTYIVNFVKWTNFDYL